LFQAIPEKFGRPLENRLYALPKKTDVAEHPEVFHHVGLLFNGPPGMAELPFI
jgi:hypothetical protein